MRGKKYFNLRPAVSVAVGICLGISAAYFFYFKNLFLGILLTVLFVVLCAVNFLPCYKEYGKHGKILLTMLMVTLFVFSGAVFGNTVNDFDNANLKSHFFSVQAKVVDVQKTDSGQRLVLDKIVLKDGVVKGSLKYKSYLYVYGDSEADVGSMVNFSAYINDRYSIYEGRFAVNDVLRGIKYTASVNDYELEVNEKSLTVFEHINLFIRDTLDSALDGDEFAVAYGLLTGNSEYMDFETINSYRMAGVAHIFAVSGLHIGFLATALGFLFDKLKANKLLKAVVITAALFFYSGICGFSVSSIRASIMSAVILFSTLKGYRYDGLSSIAIAAILILCYSPVQFFNVGFQLSFVVVLGIMLLSKPMSVPFKFLPKKISSAIGVAISAQLVSIALCLSAFGYFSPIAVIINVIFLPVVSVIFIYLLVATLLGGLFSIATVTLFPAKYVLKLINMCILAFDFEKLIIGDFSMGIFALFYYIAIIIPSDVFNFKRITRVVVSGVCALTCVLGSIYISVKEMNTTRVYVSGSETVCATVIDTPETSALILSDVSGVYSAVKLNYIASRYGVDKIDTVIFLGGFDCEEQEVLTKLRTVFDLNRICYYGEKNTIKELTIIKSFGYEVENFTDGQAILDGSVNITYALGGMAVDCVVDGNKVAVFSNGKEYNYSGLLGSYDLMICGEQADVVFPFYSPKAAVSYRRNTLYTDAERHGTAVFTFD